MKKQLMKDTANYIRKNRWQLVGVVILTIFIVLTTVFYDFDEGPKVVPHKAQKTVWVEKPAETYTETLTTSVTVEKKPDIVFPSVKKPSSSSSSSVSPSTAPPILEPSFLPDPTGGE